MSDAHDEFDPEKHQALRDQAAALLRRKRKLERERPPRLSQDEVAAKLGISRWEVRVIEARALISARRAVRKLLSNHQP